MTEENNPQNLPLEPLYLIDGSGFIFRAFHALPPLNRSDGTPVNAVLGFTNMLIKLLADKHAHRIAVIFDTKRKNFRNEIYAEYKAHRPPPPPELIPQFPLIREATIAFNLPSLELEGYEADDLIATYARLAKAKNIPVFIVSSDKDLMQLIQPGVRMLDPLKDKSIGPEEVKEKFFVAPDRVADVLALAGDASDNVPGVPGIGVKTAAQLIEEFGDLESLLSRASEIKQPKRKQLLTDFAEQARISKKLVLLDDHVPVPVPLEKLEVHTPDPSKLRTFLEAQGFRSILARLEKKESSAAPHVKLQDTEEKQSTIKDKPQAQKTEISGKPIRSYELIQDIKRLHDWASQIEERGIVGFDTETDSLEAVRANLVGISLAIAPGQACYIPLGHVDPQTPPAQNGALDFKTSANVPLQIPLKEALTVLKPLLEDPSLLKVGHNLKYDHQVLTRYGIRLSPFDDTMLMSYVLFSSLHSHGLDEIAERYCGENCIPYKDVTGTGKNQITFDRVPLDKALAYAAEDADMTMRVHSLLKPRLVSERLITVYETIERPLVSVVADMETAGIKVDLQVLKDISHDLSKRIATVESEIQVLAGQPFNVGSPKQLGEILFDKLGFPGGVKGKTGAYSTDVGVLEPLAEQGHEIAAKALEWRQWSKLKSTYTDALPEKINPTTGRIHTSFSLAATSTGRLASTDPNLQNIPIRTPEGRKIRKAFIAEKGHMLISADYSQIELRLMAEIANVVSLKEAFHSDQDIHAATASQVFGIPLNEMTPDIRRKAKAINFGIIYGISGFGLARQLDITPNEANAFIQRYFQHYPEIVDYMERTKTFCRANGYVTTLFGRKCYIPGINDKNGARRSAAERQSINAPLQGTAADIIKRAMVRLPAVLAKEQLKARMVLQVHDELLFEAPENEAEKTARVVRQVMESVASFSIPLIVEARQGANWDEAH